MSGTPNPPLDLGTVNFLKEILGFFIISKELDEKRFRVSEPALGKFEVIICARLDKTFIFKISALPHRDNGRAVHPTMSVLMDWRTPGPN